MINTSFSSNMARMPDEELIRISYSQPDEGFLPEAIDAAKAELARRSIRNDDLYAVRYDMESERHEEFNKDILDLRTSNRFAFAIFGIAFLPCIIIVMILYARGYKRMATQAMNCIVLGWVLWAVTAISVAIILSYFPAAGTR